MLHPLDFIVIAVYFIILISIGIWASRRVKDSGDFLVSGRSLGKFLSAMLGLGAATSTEQSIAVIAQSYRTGISGIWFQWVYLFGTPMAWLLAPVCRRARVHTAAEFYRLRYSNVYSVFYACLGMVTLTLTIGIMLLAMGETIEAVTQGFLQKNQIIIVIATIFLIYGLLGGLTAAAVIDSIQGLLIVFLSFGIIPFMLVKVGGFSGLHETLDPSMFSLAAPKEMTLYVIILFSIQAVIGTPGAPNVIPSYSASKKEMDARVGIVTGSIIKRFCTIGWVLMGLGAYAIFSDKIAPDQTDKVFGIAVRELLPPGLVGLMIAAMFAAVMSTCDATMVFAAGLFLKDILPVITSGKKFTPKQDVNITRVISLFVVIVAILISYIIPNIRDGFIYLWQLTLFTAFPFWCGVFWKRGTTTGAWVSVIGTFIIWLVMEITMRNCFDNNFTLKATEFLVCILSGFVLYIIFSLLSKPEAPEKLERFFHRLTTPVGTDKELDSL